MHWILTYILLFFGIFLEGEIVFLSAVIAAHQGILNIWIVVLVAIIATLTSDVFYFNAGRLKAKKWLSKSKFTEKFESVNKRLLRHRTKMLWSYRFIYGMRMITPFVLGTQEISFTYFMKYCVLSTILWCSVFVFIGYSFGEIIINNMKHIEKIEYYVIAGLIIVSLFLIISKRLKKQKLK